MKYEEIIKLLDAGYSREEIIKLDEEPEKDPEKDPEKEPEKEPETDGAAELSAAVAEMRKMFSDFTKEITAMNIMNSRQPAENENTAEEIIANIISPKLNKKGD